MQRQRQADGLARRIVPRAELVAQRVDPPPELRARTIFQRMMSFLGCRRLVRIAPCLVSMTLVISACAGIATSSSTPPAPIGRPTTSPSPTTDVLLAYDRSADPDFREEAPTRTDADGIRVTDVSYASAAGGRATAWLVQPPDRSSGPYAGLVYFHGSETDRDDFLDEAVAMAWSGAVSLVLDAPFARRGEDIRP